MLSRKKARGKARRAAKKAKAEEEYAAVAPFSLGLFKDKCMHGWNYDEYAATHDCYKLIADVLGAIPREDDKAHIVGAARAVTFKYPEIVTDSAKLEWIASAFISIGVEAYRFEDDGGWKRLCVCSMTYSEWIHQYLALTLDKSVRAMYWARHKELFYADKRRIIGYLKKRIPCSCLDSMYNAMKHLPKNGRCCSDSCSVPDRKVELSKMWSCEDCRRRRYCSEECQADDWQYHREECKVWSEWEDTEDTE